MTLGIRGAEVDLERRLKVIEVSQKNRNREFADRTGEFEEEPKGFVGGKKLKMTNGAEEEGERARQAKNTIRTMFAFTQAPAEQ